MKEIIIDFEELRKQEKQLNESWLAMFGSWIKTILDRMFSGSSLPVRVKGSKREVGAFAQAVSSEKRYMDSFMQYGLDDPRTYKSRAKLDTAINKFERATGLKWPIE